MAVSTIRIENHDPSDLLDAVTCALWHGETIWLSVDGERRAVIAPVPGPPADASLPVNLDEYIADRMRVPLTRDYAKALGLILDAAWRGERFSYQPEDGDLIDGDAAGPLNADGSEAASDTDVRECFIGVRNWHRGRPALTAMWPAGFMVDAYRAGRLKIDPAFYEGQQ